MTFKYLLLISSDLLLELVVGKDITQKSQPLSSQHKTLRMKRVESITLFSRSD